MRNFNIALLAVVVVLVASGSAFALIDDSDIKYLDFTGWDDTLIAGAGQTFVGLDAGSTAGTVDVTVTRSAGVASSLSGTTTIGTILALSGTQDFDFTFSKPLRFIVHHRTTDKLEDVTLETTTPVGHMQIAGASVLQSPFTNGLRVDGQAFGIPPSGGAAEGQFTALGGASAMTYTVGSDNDFYPQYDFFRVGVLIPEPNTSALAGIGLLGMVMSLRRRRN